MTVDDSFPQHWPWRSRQRWLKYVHGFTCACARCVREAAALGSAMATSSSLCLRSKQRVTRAARHTQSQQQDDRQPHQYAGARVNTACDGVSQTCLSSSPTPDAAFARSASPRHRTGREIHPFHEDRAAAMHVEQPASLSMRAVSTACACNNDAARRALCDRPQSTMEQLLLGARLRPGRPGSEGSGDGDCAAHPLRYFREMARHATNARGAGVAPCVTSEGLVQWLPLSTVLHEAECHLLPSHYLLVDLHEGTRRVAEGRGNSASVVAEGKKELLFHESMWMGVTPAKLRIVRDLIITSDGSLRRHAVPPRAPHNTRAGTALPISSDWPSVIETWRSTDFSNSQILESCYRFYEAWYS